jgi:signal transduction histidine kinase
MPLARARAGLEHLQAAQLGRSEMPDRSSVRLDGVVRGNAAGYREAAGREGRVLNVRWRAGGARVAADPGALSSALGNVLANALEHGRGDVELRGRRAGSTVRLEVLNGGRPGPRRRGGLGVGIARRAARDAGGSLDLRADGDGTAAVIELPLAE